jgi:2-polyprenyl-3-methyl-5-hydroxy-6-metoxy-1,4-benzoquinol methylase
MTRLAARIRRDELMDDPDLDPATYEIVLRDLARVNAWTLAARPTLAFLARGTKGMERFRLLDVGFGHGDMLRRIARWARKRGIAAQLVGVDLNPRSAQVARAVPGRAIDYRTGDYRDIEGRVDFVISSLVAHHMSDIELRDFIRFMEAKAQKGWLINDLHRHGFAYAGFPLLARLLRAHPVVRADGRTSIGRAFRPADWRGILSEAGVPDGAAKVVRRFPFRLCVERLS